MKKILRSSLTLTVVLLAFAIAGLAQTSPTSPTRFPGVNISNFGKMDNRFYRGGQPKKDDYAALKSLGVHTIIDLQDSTKNYEKTTAESLGMKYVNIPIVDKTAPTQDEIATFLKTVDEPDTGVFYVHCAGGRHRTGDMGALYRLTKYNWTYDQAYQEMLNYDFYTSNGHGKQKDFVVDLFAKANAARTTVAAAK